MSVDGAGSLWSANNALLQIGNSGVGKLYITGGGAVTVGGVSVRGAASMLAIDVGNGSRLTVGNGYGGIQNNGIVRFLAGAGPTAGATFTPISAGDWIIGTGTYQPFGGTWDATNHVFTVSAVQAGTSGMGVFIDRSDKQRVKIDDPITGWSLGVSFPAATSPAPLSFAATAISGITRTRLQDLLAPDQSVLSGWSLSASGYCSFDIGTGYLLNNLQLWRYNGIWSKFDAPDLTYNGRYASFSPVSSLVYAITAVPVPEPGTLVLLLAAGLGLLGYASHRHVRKKR